MQHERADDAHVAWDVARRNHRQSIDECAISLNKARLELEEHDHQDNISSQQLASNMMRVAGLTTDNRPFWVISPPSPLVDHEGRGLARHVVLWAGQSIVGGVDGCQSLSFGEGTQSTGTSEKWRSLCGVEPRMALLNGPSP